MKAQLSSVELLYERQWENSKIIYHAVMQFAAIFFLMHVNETFFNLYYYDVLTTQVSDFSPLCVKWFFWYYLIFL